MKHTKLLAYTIIACALAAGIWTLFIPLPPGAETRTGLFTQLGFSVAMLVLFTGAAVIFLQGLKNFTDKLKIAYGILCGGIVMIALAQLQVPVFTWLDMMETFWVRSGPIVLPFILAVVAMFIGVRAIGRLFGVSGLLVSGWFFFAATIVGSLLVTFLPHGATPTAELEFDASTALPAWTDVGMLICIGILLQTKRKASVLYADAFAWLIIGLAATTTISLGYVTMALILGDQHWLVMDGFIYAVFVVAGIILVRAAYAFYAIPAQAAVTNSQEVNFFGKSRQVAAKPNATSVDIVSYAASLASKTEDIAHEIDTISMISSRGDAAQLTPQDTTTLKETYLHIEDYLVTHEPVRKFDRGTLRQHIQSKLHLDPASPTFWKEI